MKTFVYADQFFFVDEVRGPGYLEVTDGVFGAFQTERPEQATIIDHRGKFVAPGLVDTHIHGYKGHDVMDNDLAGLGVIAEGLLSCGVTSFLPTTLTASAELLSAVCRTIGEGAASLTGAKIRGIFLEGPFFSEVHKGAQNPKYMGDPDCQLLDEWHAQSQGLVNKIAIAPERDGTVPFVHHARQKGVYVALAHSDATYEQAKAAVDAGASIFVHTYNGMRGLHHREPGMVGAALTCREAYDELICDGHHVHPVSAQVVLDCHGRDKTVFITDCMRAGGLGDGPSTLGEFDVVVTDGAARLVHNGSLAGSVLELYQAVKNAVEWGIATPLEAIRMASYNAAESVGLEDVCGSLTTGHAADFIVLEADLTLHATYLDGVQRYVAKK